MSLPSTTTSNDFGSNFLVFKEASSFKEKEAFQEIKELVFLSYYKDFKLVLCAKCLVGLNSSTFRSHIHKHLKLYSKIDKEALLSQALAIFSTLEVSSLKDSLGLIVLFSKHFELSAFKELDIIDLFICNLNSNCSMILSSQYSIKRHIREHHIGSSTTSYRVIRGQALEINKFFFEIKPSSSIDSSILGLSSPTEYIEPLEQAKDLFLAKYSKKEEQFLNKLSSFKLDPKEKLTPFQVKTRYIEYISKHNTKDLVDLVSPLSKEELVLEVLVLNLKEILYLSLEKSIFLNKIHLNILNSFEPNKIRNKPFQPMLTSNTRVKYFNFYALFLAFVYRALSKSLEDNTSYFKASSSIVTMFNSLNDLVDLKLEEDNYLELSNKALKQNKKSINKKLNKYKLNSLLSNRASEDQEEEEDNDDEETSSTSSIDISTSCSSTSDASHSLISSSSSSNSSSSLIFQILESSNIEILDEIRDINKSKDSISLKIKDLVVKLLISLFRQETDLYIFDSAINSFFASISIRNNSSFKDTLELSQDYSKFIYSSQLIVLEYSFRRLLEDQSLDLASILRQFQQRYFNNSSSSALSEVLNNRSYCFKVNKELSTQTYVSISTTSKETVSYKKVTISTDNLRLLFKELISTSYDLLIKKLLLGIPKSLYKDITLAEFSKLEDRSMTTPFKCFRDLSPNLKANNSFLKDLIFKDSSLFNRFFILRDLELVLNNDTISIYLKDLLEFKKLCLLLIYLTTGLPLRGTELVTLRYLNSYKDQREMFLDLSSNLFIMNISYYKGQGLSEKKASNIRYLPTSVSKIFLLYIVLVDPFISFLNISTLSPKKLNKTKSLVPYYFFVNNRLLESRDLSLKLSSFSSLILGRKLGIQVYRQIIITIIKQFMLEKLNSYTLLLEEEEKDLNKLVASQSNHSSRVEDLNYGRSNLIFHNINSNLQFKYLQFCLRYFAYFKLDLLDIQVESYKNQLSIQNRLRKNESLNIVNSLAIKYSKTSSLSQLESSSSSTSRKHSRQVSSISSTSLVVPKKVKTIDLYNLSSLDTSSNVLPSLLQEFLQDNKASFRSLEQELLLKSILLKVPYILGVLPTSIGKSLTYLLSSSLSISKVTIVIIPLVGLKLDILRRAQAYNIPSNIYEETSTFSNLTLVSIETIVSPNFISLVEGLIYSSSLDRIIVDECHLLITASSYRSIMFRFKELLLLKVQFVFLTGTLPYSFEDELVSTLLLDDLSVIRADCLRPNISYKARPYKSNKEEDKIKEIQEYINSFKAREFLSLEDKIIIFCPSINNIILVADTLNCSKYYSSLSTEEKQSTLTSFFTSKEEYYNILVTSSSLEEGLDYSSIRLVIYKDIAYSFLGFLQGSSRGGRDNKPSTSMFFYNSSQVQKNSSSSTSTRSLLEQDKFLVSQYLLEVTCRRRQISLYLDNKPRLNCSNIESPCDLCTTRSSIINNQVSKVLESSKKTELARIKLRDDIVSTSPKCLFCLLVNHYYTIDHSSSSCPIFSNIEAIAKRAKSLIQKQEVRLEADSCCFTCLLPTVICAQLKESNKCLLPMFMIRALAVIYYKQEELKLETKYSLPPNASLKVFLCKALSKVFIKELDTEGILGLYTFVYDS
jgi:superfamily II DNA helicase RecQ/predicted RNA binding protein with dsRBD fold (UPF0201 family)